MSEVSKRFNALAERIGIKARVLSVYPGAEEYLAVFEALVDAVEEIEKRVHTLEFPTE